MSSFSVIPSSAASALSLAFEFIQETVILNEARTEPQAR
jgi:hypothetical protein